MSKRGSGSSARAGGGRKKATESDGTISAKEYTRIESYERRTSTGYGLGAVRYRQHEVLEATTDGNGNLTFSYAEPDERTTASRTTIDLVYNIKAGAKDGTVFGINWDKVQSVKGQTYGIRAEAKANGLSWDGATKSWKRKK